MIASTLVSESSSDSALTKSRLSSDVWYSGYLPFGVRVRTILTLIVTVGDEIKQRVRTGQAKDVGCCPIHQGCAPTTAFVRGLPAIAQAGQHEAMANASRFHLVPS